VTRKKLNGVFVRFVRQFHTCITHRFVVNQEKSNLLLKEKFPIIKYILSLQKKTNWYQRNNFARSVWIYIYLRSKTVALRSTDKGMAEALIDWCTMHAAATG
jgi:hypothetical protein